MCSQHQSIWKVKFPVTISKTLKRTKILIPNSWKFISSTFITTICPNSLVASDQCFKASTRFSQKGFWKMLFQKQFLRHVHQFGWMRWDEGRENKCWSAALQSKLHHALFSLSLWTGSSLARALQYACSEGTTYIFCFSALFANKVRSQTQK